MKIKGEKIVLKPIEQKDLERIRLWRNLYSSEFFSGEEISKEQQRLWYERYQASGGKDTMFMVELPNGMQVGTIALYDVSIPDRTARLGRVLLLEEHRGNGYMDEAVQILTNYAFTKMRLYKIRVEVFLTNAVALSLYAKSGYKATTRPMILMEKVNIDYNPLQPLEAENLESED